MSDDRGVPPTGETTRPTIDERPQRPASPIPGGALRPTGGVAAGAGGGGGVGGGGALLGRPAATFFEPPSAPPELLPKMVGASVHGFRYSTFVRESDHRGLAIDYDAACGVPHNPAAPGKPHPLLGIFIQNPCPVLHLGYLASHRQRWLSRGTALGEVVYSLSLAPGESRNIAVIDLRRRQQGRRQEQTDAQEDLISNQDHTFALQEVAAAVALEHQHGKTSVEASTLVTGGAFVAAGALVGGIGGGIIGSFVKPGLGTAVGAGLGAGAGVAAGGLVFAGAQALGMIEAESSGDRDVMGETNQRIAQATSQQSALIRSLWSTVVTEDVQEERFEAQTSNITNYNHMHALNMQYYEVLHRYSTVTAVERVIPLLYLPFGALPLEQVELIDEFWDSIRTGLPEDLRDKGDAVFVDPPPPAFVPEPVPPTPSPPTASVVSMLSIDVEVEWDLEWADAIVAALGYFVLGAGGLAVLMLMSDEVLRSVTLELELSGENGTYYVSPPASLNTRHDDFGRGVTTFGFSFTDTFDGARISGVRVQLNSPTDIFDDGVNVRVRVAGGTASGGTDMSLAGMQISRGGLTEIDQAGGRAERVFPWAPVEDLLDDYEAQLREIAAVERRNDEGAEAHQALVDQLDSWRQQVIEAVQREHYRFTRIILSSMETGRLTWILDRLVLTGDDDAEPAAFPLHAIAHTTPIGISDDSVVLKMKHFDGGQAEQTLWQLDQFDAESAYDVKQVLMWHRSLSKRFTKLDDLTVEDEVVLPGAGVFAEAVLGRSNASEYIDPDRYWNWQDSPIPHQAPQILPVSTDQRTTAPLPTDPTVPDATLPLVGAPAFPAPTGLASVLQAVQNGSMFRDMSKADQLAGVLGGLADLAGETAKSAANMTGDAASDALSSATDIGKSVAAMTEKLMSQAPKQAAAPPKNPTTASAAGTAVERSQDKPAEVVQAVKDAWGVPGSGGGGSTTTGPGAPGGGPSGSPTSPSIPAGPPPWRPVIDPSRADGPGQVSSIPATPPPVQLEVEGQLVDALDAAAADTGTMPDTSDLIAPMEHWYRDSVLPLLIYARHNEEYLTSAINQYLDWLATMQQLGLDTEAEQMANLHGDGRALIEFGLENAIGAGFGQMEANNDLDYLVDVLNWAASAAQLGFDGSDSELFEPNNLGDHSPIHVVLAGPLEPVDDLADGESYNLQVTGGLAIGVNPPLVGQVVAVTVTIDNGSAAPSQGSIHPGLTMTSTIVRNGTAPMAVTVTGRAELLQGAWTFETTRTVTIA